MIGTLIILAMLFWAVGFIGLFDLVSAKAPWYARLDLLYAFYGCPGGIGFGWEGIYSDIFDITDKMGLRHTHGIPMVMNIALFWSGSFPFLTLVVYGVYVAITGSFPRWIDALLALGGIAFPLNRISRELVLANAAGAILLIQVVAVAVIFWKTHPTGEGAA